MMFSVGMATYDDFDGVYFTCMSLLAHHPLATDIFIIDNNPNGPAGGDLRNFAQNCGKVRYIPFDAAIGTAAPRNAVFAHAKQDNVVCLDSHVLLLPGALEAIRDYDGPQDALIRGPLVMDNMVGLATHFEDTWNS